MDINLTILDVPIAKVDNRFDEKHYLYQQTVANLSKIGITHIRNNTKRTATGEIDKYQLSCKANNMLVLKDMLQIGVRLDCDGRLHRVEFPISLTKYCNQCTLYDECGYKYCKHPKHPKCSKCGKEGHTMADCLSKLENYTCPHCDRDHIGGSNRCGETFDRNCKKNRFIIEFLMGEEIVTKPHLILKVPQPDNKKPVNYQISEEEQERKSELNSMINDMVNDRIAPIQARLNSIDKRLEINEIKTQKNEEDIASINGNIHEMRTEMNSGLNKTNDGINNLNMLMTEFMKQKRS